MQALHIALSANPVHSRMTKARNVYNATNRGRGEMSRTFLTLLPKQVGNRYPTPRCRVYPVKRNFNDEEMVTWEGKENETTG